MRGAGGREPDDGGDERSDELLGVLHALTALVGARGEADVLRLAVEAACRATGSRRGLAGRFDGEAATSVAWYEVDAGWTGAPQRWAAGEGAPGVVCLTAKSVLGGRGPRDGERALGIVGVPGMERFACVALPGVEGTPRGFLAVGDRDDNFTPRDVRLLAALGEMASLRIDEATGHGRLLPADCAASIDIAERLQRRLLPQEPPRLEGLDIAFSYRSASAGVLSGGDFVDYYSRSPGVLAFAIGDVAGKGVEAMAVTFVTKYILRAAVHGGQLSWPTSPGEALQELRTGLLEQPDFGPDSERFVTVLFGLLGTRRGLLQLASAGHPTPFIVRATGVERPLLLTEPAIGVELGAALAPYPTETIELRRGDVVVLFTDGIAELRNGSGRFFEDEMGSLLAACHDMPTADVVARLMAAGEAFSARPPGDDLALLCIRLVADPGVH
ncbi:MAG: SpoIIE family protein phosphatase [Actinobacteria bacterium]|nr:SpoIIE family protein phosphatase [Actinomycetota bacterium]